MTAIDEIMAPNYIGHVPGFPPSDREGDKQLIAMFRAVFPDLHFTLEAQIGEGEQAEVPIGVSLWVLPRLENKLR